MSLRQLLKDSTGLDLSIADVERAVRERMLRLGVTGRQAYEPLPGTAEFECLVDLVTVPESWMFRDPDVFTEALRFVQRRLLSLPVHPVRILSLPCAGGEEPYSMAMALERAGIPPSMCRIDAIDLSQAAIARARLGRYTRNAFRGADLAFRERWFRQEGEEYVIDQRLQRYITFSQGNLLALHNPGGSRYDLVFCRNLLIYFDDATRAAAISAVHALLADDGLLLSGYAEAPAFCRGGFAPQSLRSTFALHKHAAVPVGARARTRPPLPVPPRPVSAVRTQARLPSPDALVADARRLADAGRFPQADLACRDALALDAAHAGACFLLGLISESCGQPRAAERHWRRCVYLQPDHYEALCSLALLLDRLGEAGPGAAFRQRAARIFARSAGAGVRAATEAGA